MLKVFVMLLLMLISQTASAQAGFINIRIENSLIAEPSVSISVADFKTLLEESFKDKLITLNGAPAEVNIDLRVKEKTMPQVPRFPSSIPYPDQTYEWTSVNENGAHRLTLTANSGMGIVFGMYGLLQEKLNFRFYHPKDTFIPEYYRWPLPDKFTFSGEPLFGKRGFHLHTMHPIELTEQLHSGAEGGGISDIKEYINWLVRNGQNVMQFWLLRTVERESWPQYAKQYVSYAKRRGILTGVVISLSTLQQNAFQTVNLLNLLTGYKTQIDRNIKWLMQVPFDYVNIDFTMGEYLPDLSALMPSLKSYLINSLKDNYGVYVNENTHVIKRTNSNSPDVAGKLIHSVMFYSLADESAPVYGNKNQMFMYDMLTREKEQRETWYWPESSYWVTFDTSVPVFLLPYLKSRLDDIRLVSATGADGHITFTSGWEWGYWMIDYSIARWTWSYKTNGLAQKRSSVGILADLFENDAEAIFNYAENIQEKYLKHEKLIGLLAAKTPFEELPWPFNRQFQPTSGYSMLKASMPLVGKKDRELIKAEADMLEEFSEDMLFVVNALRNNFTNTDNLRNRLREEIIFATEITALRAKHRSLTMLAGAYRNTNLNDSSRFYYESLLAEAEKVRMRAMRIVRQEEWQYRYPPLLIARKMKSFTSYDFGYLYPVSGLYFWEREEKQVRYSRFDAFFMNLWDFWDTLGLDGLF